MAFEDETADYVAAVNRCLADNIAAEQTPARLGEAMRYAVLGGGKRIRPLLVYAAGRLVGAQRGPLDAAAAAVELVHSYSLVHDDLPAMDDDDLRRGQPSVHIAYDEATAILAGDALLTLAFELLTRDGVGWPRQPAAAESVQLLAQAAGGAGMVGGQVLDLGMEGGSPEAAEIERMFMLKTGALIRASVLLGASAGRQPLDPSRASRLGEFAACVGICFQLQDDILDVAGQSEAIGKPLGSDAARGKPNYALRFGLAAARERASRLYEQALEALEIFAQAGEPLRWMAAYITRRDR